MTPKKSHLAAVVVLLMISLNIYAECVSDSDGQGRKLPCMNSTGRGDSSGSNNTSASDAAAASVIINGVSNILKNQIKNINSATSEKQRLIDQQKELEQEKQIQSLANEAEYKSILDQQTSFTGLENALGNIKSEALQDAKKITDDVCDCSVVVGACQAKIEILHTTTTGADFKVSSSAQRCSKVSYYIDQTLYLTVFQNSSSAIEHSAGLNEITINNFQVESCHLCSAGKAK